MKRILLSLLALAFTAGSAMAAGSYGNAVPFSNFSTNSGSAQFSAAYNVRGFKVKSATLQGVLVADRTDSTYLPGTLAIQCAPTASGPWRTCINSSYAQTAVSGTTNTVLTWTDASAYIRASWTKTAAGLVKVWLNWNE